MRPLRIHIENDASGAEAVRLTAARLRGRLDQAGLLDDTVEVSQNSEARAMATAIAEADILFACRKLSIAEAKRAAPDLAWVQVISAGVESLVADIPDGVVLTNASGVHGPKGGEYALAAALMLTYRIPAFASDKNAARWQPSFGGTARGKRVLLLGVGGIGAAAAPWLHQHAMVVTGMTRSGRADVALDRCIGPEDLDTTLAETDILISTLPLTPQTNHLIDRRRLELLPRGAGVIILGRANVFDYDALADLLDSDHLEGAVLDVFPQEPLPPEHRLWQTPRLIMTLHCSVDDHTVYMDRCLDIFVDNVRRFRAGERLANIVDPALGY